MTVHSQHIGITIPFLNCRLPLYNNTSHDDHHVYRSGNYGNFCGLFDYMFDTKLPAVTRKPLPTSKLWQKVHNKVAILSAMGILAHAAAKNKELNQQEEKEAIVKALIVHDVLQQRNDDPVEKRLMW